MRIYKAITKWFDHRYGGEDRIHADFEVEAGERLSHALHELFSVWEHDHKTYERKIHLTISIYPADQEGIPQIYVENLYERWHYLQSLKTEEDLQDRNDRDNQGGD